MLGREEQRTGTSVVGRYFEDILGPVVGRYFGSGFRRVSHAYTPLERNSYANAVTIQGVGIATYPTDWSLDATGMPRAVHLSSFDAIAFTAAAIRAEGQSRRNAATRLGRRVRRLRVKAPGQPILTTSDVDVSVQCTGADVESDVWVSSTVGGFAIDMDLGSTVTQGEPIDLQLHDSSRPPGLGSGRVLAIADGVLETVQHLNPDRSGFSSVEELSMFGQLGQIAVYAAKRVDRGSVPNLWLRRLVLERADSAPVGLVRARVEITRDRLVRFGDGDVADIALTARTNYGARAEASFGFRVPP